MEAKTAKGAKTKKRILEAGERLINERGYENVTLVDICKEAGVAKGQFYHYFSSTKDILAALMDGESEALQWYYSKMEGGPAIERLEEIAALMIDFWEARGKQVFAEALYIMMFRHPGFSTTYPYIEIVEEIISKGQQAGEIPTHISSKEAAVIFVSLSFFYSLSWIGQEEEISLKDFALHKIIDIFQKTLLSKK